MNQQLLVMFVGGPGSGKTTFSRLLAKKLNAVTLNSDAVRVSMWGSKDNVKLSHTNPAERGVNNGLTFGALDYAARQILGAGHNVIYDANANKPIERAKLAGIAKQHDATPVVVWLRTSPEVAVARIVTREDVHDQNQHEQDKAREIVESFRQAIVEPAEDENVIEISGELPFDEQYSVFQQHVCEIFQ